VSKPRWPRGAIAPEGMSKSEGSAGAKALRSCCNNRAALQRPRRLLAVPRVRSHRQRAHRSGPGAIAPEPLASRTLSCCAPNMERRCRRASVRFVAIAHSPDRRPRNLQRAKPRVRRPRRYGRCLNRVTAPAPQSRSAAASLTGRDGASVGAPQSAGIRSFARAMHQSADLGSSLGEAAPWA
jgi:hypothetical protein